MENNLNPIDNFFKQSLSELEYEDKKGNWELMNHLLIEEEKKKKTRRVIIFFLLTGLIITSGLIFLFTNHESSKSKSPAATRGVESNVNRTDSKKQDQQLHSPVLYDRDSKKQQEQKTKPVMTTDHLEQSGNASKEPVMEKSFASTQQHQESFIKQTPSDNNNKLVTEAEIIFPAEKNNDSVIKSAVPELLQSGEKITVDSIAVTTPNTNATDSSILFATVEPDIVDSVIQNSSTALTNDSSLQTTIRSFEISLYGGANLYQTGYGSSNVSPIAGLALRKMMDKNFKVEIACLYSLQGGYDLNDTETVMTESYFLDKEVNVYSASINIKRQHKLYFPITFYYMIAERHALLGAVQFSFVLNTEGDYSEKNIISGITSETKNEDVKGYMDGIRTTNYGLSLGYQYTLLKNFDVQARIARDLLGSYSEDNFYGVETNPLWSLQAYIIFKF